VRTITLPSKGEINRCGSYLVSLAHGAADGRDPYDPDRVEHAITVVSEFRAAHQYPLTKVAVGLRSMVNSEGAEVVVAQRLKRLPRILRKLHRMQGTNLARLEDIGGCRAVLQDGEELRRVLRRMRRRSGTSRPRVS